MSCIYDQLHSVVDWFMYVKEMDDNLHCKFLQKHTYGSISVYDDGLAHVTEINHYKSFLF